MRPIPAVAPLCLWALAACGGSERPGRVVGEQDMPEVVALGDPQVAPVQLDTMAGAGEARLECETGISADPDTSNVLNRNETRAWARPDQAAGGACAGPDAASAGSRERVDPAALKAAGSTASLTQLRPTSPAAVEEESRSVSDFIPRIPLAPGLTIVQTLHFSGGDRESVETVDEVSPAGVRYGWRFVEVHEAGDTLRREYTRFVSAADLAGARRLHEYAEQEGPAEHPSYTWRSISTATYRTLLATGSDSFQIMTLERPAAVSRLGELGFAPFRTGAEAPVRWRGTLTLASETPLSFPLLVNGRRVTVPALHLKGQFAARGNQWAPEIWVLADSAHPLMLKWVKSAFAEPGNVLQVVRVDLPGGSKKSSDEQDEVSGKIEHVLSSACRVELPGVYFGFASAELQSASAPALAGVAELLKRHPDWSFAIEGHTDSVGDPGSNLVLSKRRAQSVKVKLVQLHQIDPKRLQAEGYGAFRPREPNTTIEGRARNRRVELVRDCDNPRAR